MERLDGQSLLRLQRSALARTAAAANTSAVALRRNLEAQMRNGSLDRRLLPPTALIRAYSGWLWLRDGVVNARAVVADGCDDAAEVVASLTRNCCNALWGRGTSAVAGAAKAAAGAATTGAVSGLTGAARGAASGAAAGASSGSPAGVAAGAAGGAARGAAVGVMDATVEGVGPTVAQAKGAFPPGPRIRRPRVRTPRPIDGPRLIHILFDCFGNQMLHDGLFNGDPHPGVHWNG
jgi:hypothetical protein